MKGAGNLTFGYGCGGRLYKVENCFFVECTHIVCVAVISADVKGISYLYRFIALKLKYMVARMYRNKALCYDDFALYIDGVILWDHKLKLRMIRLFIIT